MMHPLAAYDVGISVQHINPICITRPHLANRVAVTRPKQA